MKKAFSFICVLILIISLVGCAKEINTIKDFTRFENMTRETDKIEVEFDNHSGASFCFTIEDQETIDEIMDIIFSSSFKNIGKEPPAGDNSTIKIIQGENKYSIGVSRIREGDYFYTFVSNDLEEKIIKLAEKAGAYEATDSPKLVNLEQYSAMTINGTTSIEVVYDYIDGEETTYEFVIEDQETIEKIMAEVFNTELKDYPADRDIDIYQRWIVIEQGDNRFHIDLTLASDGEKQYICQSKSLREMIETYIEDNLIECAGENHEVHDWQIARQEDSCWYSIITYACSKCNMEQTAEADLALPNHNWAEEIVDGKTTFGCTRCNESNTFISEIREFSYAQAREYYKIGDPGVKHENFINPAIESEITGAIDAIVRAKFELTIEYDTISVFYDEISNMWRVDFWSLNVVGGGQSVYVNNQGLTCYVIYGE